MLRRRKYNKDFNLKKLIPFLVLSVVIFLTIGFSAFQNQLDIDDLALTVRIQRDIRITGINLSSAAGDAISDWEDYNVDSISSGISLPNSNSTVTYNVLVNNIGNVEASISEITGLPSNLTYTINNYNLRNMLCDDNDPTLCKLGSVTTLSITVGYKENGYNSNNTDYTIGMDFTFTYMVDAVAKMGEQYYDTLQDAINDVPTDNSLSSIILLKNSSEVISIVKNKNIVLNLNNKTLSNYGNNPVIKNNGTLNISGGTVATSAATNGAINNESTGNIILDGLTVNVTGGRQALYNNKGVATITGNSYLISSATERGAVQNVAGGTLNVLSGTIISTGSSGLVNAGSMTIGMKDGIVNNYPVIQGKNYGVSASANYNFYDGILKGQTAAINNESRIVELESGYGLLKEEETIDGIVYKIAFPGMSQKVTFNPSGGTVSETTRYIARGKPVGALPTPTRSGYAFDGWYTQSSGGSQISASTIITDDITFYAHWKKTTDVAQIGSTMYDTLQEAVNAAPSNTQTIITLLKNVSEQIEVPATKNVIIDLNNNNLTSNGNKSVVENNGILTFINGTISSNADVGAINNLAGHLTIDGASVIATGTRQAIYITGGIVEIKGSAYLNSQTSGVPTTTTMERGTIQCLSEGTLIITGGTIIGSKQQAVSNEGSLTIGVKDGNISTSSPVLIGNVRGVRNVGTFNFYNGIIKGKTEAINGAVSDVETGAQVTGGTEVIDGATYKTAYLS